MRCNPHIADITSHDPVSPQAPHPLACTLTGYLDEPGNRLHIVPKVFLEYVTVLAALSFWIRLAGILKRPTVCCPNHNPRLQLEIEELYSRNALAQLNVNLRRADRFTV